MKGWVLLLAIVLAAPVTASAQAVELGLGRRLDQPLRRAPAPSEHEDDGEAESDEEEGPWPGPQIQLGYAYWKLADAHGGGDVHVASFEAFVHWPLPQLRTGVLGEIGARDFSLAGDDLIVRGAVELGVQLTDLLEPVVPHLSVIGTFGGLVGERFETTVSYAFGGGGIELGAALRFIRNVHLAASISYLRLEMDGAAFDVVMFRAALGL